MTASNIHYELADRTRATAHGGIGAIHLLVRKLGLDRAINAHLGLLKIHLPYHDSDHVLNIAYNLLAGGTCLEHLELLRSDEAYLDALGARRVPDPTTAGDYCRRFDAAAIFRLQAIFNAIRLEVWRRQPESFFDEAILDADGTMVETTGECKQDYRVVVVWKELDVYQGQKRLFDDARCFFYLTNDEEKPAEEIVFDANQRCNQENLLAQLKGGVRSLTAPVDSLLANWAYMVMASLAWSLKAWAALVLPETGRWRETRQEEKRKLLQMDFSTFRAAMMRIPAQIITTGRRIVYRLLGWNPWQQVFFRLLDQLRRPLRC